MTTDGQRLYQYGQSLAGVLGVGLGAWCFTAGDGPVWLLVAGWAGAFTVQTYLRYLQPMTTLEYGLGEAVLETLAHMPPGGSVTVTRTEIVPDYPPAGGGQ